MTTTPTFTKEEVIENFIKAFAAIEDSMEPFKEQKKDLRENYIDQGWMSRQELRTAIKAYRLLKGDADMQMLNAFYDKLSTAVGR